MSKTRKSKESASDDTQTSWVINGHTIPQLVRRLCLRLNYEQQEGLSLLCDGAARHLHLAKFNHGSADDRFASETCKKRVMAYACIYSNEKTQFVFSEDYVKGVVDAITCIPDGIDVTLTSVATILLLPSMMEKAESQWGSVASDRQVFKSLTNVQRRYAVALSTSLNQGLGVGALPTENGALLGPAALFVAAAEIARARHPGPPCERTVEWK